MVAPAALYVCTACNASVRKWMPRCPTCGALGSVRGADAAATGLPRVVDIIAPAAARVPVMARALPSASDRRDAEDPDDDDAEEFPGDEPIAITEVPADAYQRISTGMPPLDRVLGGGLVVGSIVLLGGDPGAGKSTLLVQVAALLACGTVLYASGEESAGQVADRARRVDAARPHIQIVRESRLERILDLAERRGARVLVVDSVHTLTTEYASGITGSVTQVRECTARLMAFAKATGIVVIVIGHITKDGSLAGPKTLEHLVDAVLLLSAYGDAEMADTPYRTLRSFKNRFGDTTERGHFEMRPGGLAEAFLLPGDDGLHEELVPVAQELLNRYRRLGGHVDEGLRDRIAGRLDCDGEIAGE